MRLHFFYFSLALLFATVTSCKKDDPDEPADSNTTPLKGDKTTWWKPVTGVSFDWELDDITSTSVFAADVVDVDAFTTSAETVAALHAQGKKVIAYISAGTIEEDRPDGNLLPKEIIGKVYPEWPKEKWLDIRQIDKLKPWLNARINMILTKGFDGIEADNLDGYNNDTGFDIQVSDLKKYLDYLLTLAHTNGLSIGQKNVEELADEYASKCDWIITEDAYAQGWQDQVSAYITLGKPVFAVEYTDNMSQTQFEQTVCPAAKLSKYTAILKERDLTQWVYRCN